ATDPTPCGTTACPGACPRFASCAASACSCPAAAGGATIATCGFGAAATCTDTSDDQNNCGGCGTTCGTFANRYCNGSGVCAPTPGDTDCTGGGLTLAVNL